jgi:hypothetical protein
MLVAEQIADEHFSTSKGAGRQSNVNPTIFASSFSFDKVILRGCCS